jgi:hypothetical protein
MYLVDYLSTVMREISTITAANASGSLALSSLKLAASRATETASLSMDKGSTTATAVPSCSPWYFISDIRINTQP